MADNSLFAPGFKGIQSLELLPTNTNLGFEKLRQAFFQPRAGYASRPSLGRAFAAVSASDIVGPVAFGPIIDKRLPLPVQQSIGAPAPVASPTGSVTMYSSGGVVRRS